MKGKLIKGKGARGCLAYVLGKEHCRIVGGNMAGQTPRQLSAEFALSRQLAPDAANPVIHMPLSVPPGEHLTDEQWQQAAHIVMRSMGMDPDNHQHVIVKHTDRDHEHVHVVASRIGIDGKKWNVSHDVRKMIDGTQEAERALGLTQTKGLESKPAKRTRPEAPGVGKLQTAIDAATTDRPTFRAFVERLEADGVKVHPAMSKDGGRLNGMSFERDGVAFKGSALGTAYGFGQLQKRMDFDLERDRALLLSLRDGTERPAAPAAASTPAAPSAQAKTEPAKADPTATPATRRGSFRPVGTTSRGAASVGASNVQTRGKRNDTALADLTEAEEIEAQATAARLREIERQQAAGYRLPDFMSGTLAAPSTRPTTTLHDAQVSKPAQQADHGLPG
ncbi:relaxase/mobilization nuclease domain-containing protein, partial [Burkholderia cenocepacia]|uniref:relaxase/mobilization nuclease domain-containing protein n=1 Tax=Burkholderia cenocepacia TaxID=95486 RepID=UPI002AB7C399